MAHNGGPIWGRKGEIGAIALNNPLVLGARPRGCHVAKRRASESLMACYFVRLGRLRATHSSQRTGAVGVRIDAERPFAGDIVDGSLQPEPVKGRTESRSTSSESTPPSLVQLSLYSRRLAPVRARRIAINRRGMAGH
jgi:hypothetical protein